MAEEGNVSEFVKLGLSEQKARETTKNAAVTNTLLAIVKEVRQVALSDGTGILLYHLATRIKPQIHHHLPLLIKYVVSKKLDSTMRVDKAIEFALNNIKSLDTNDLEKYCGVSVLVTPEEIEKVVDKHISENKKEILEKRYKFNVGPLMQKIKIELPWAEGKAVKSEVDIQLLDLLGPKTESDFTPLQKNDNKGSKPQKGKQEKVVKSSEKQILSMFDVMRKINFHSPGENFKTDGYVVTDNTEKLLKEHLKVTGGKVRTRFPPEPNGILHIGHAKAININFGYAAANEGICFLRYDDTNPEKEEEKFFTGILDMVTWLGYKPYKITHSSDYFDQLYIWAVKLIEKGQAYVCHQTADEMKGFNPMPSPWRDRPIEENLQLFEDMKNGKVDEGASTLRMKITLEEGKLDPVAYRVRFTPHHRTGDKWCIYPTYDYTHCLCDSIEHITHSLCTKEFQSRRSSYYWLCNTLDIYCPVQWEYGRLNMNYTVVSKRKIGKLIEEGIVKDWDDPRLFTLTALRRRGFPPETVNNFCAQLGVTGAQSSVDPSMLEAFVRDSLNNSAPRTMVVLEPLKVTIENYPNKGPVQVSIPNFPNKPDLGQHSITFDKVIYIDRSDFQEIGEKGYRRLTKTQPVGLRHAGYILEVASVEKNAAGHVVQLFCKCVDVDKASTKPKAFVHWVAEPLEIEVRLYSSLFIHKNPENSSEVPGGFLSDCNRDSLKIVKSFADKTLSSAKIYDRFQFERIGFFAVDQDSTEKTIVFNRTVGLKEDTGK
ncbi:probable glutamine--tRNA ligase [Cylas formicarius]|uniref:probable glutamine--tRNA ligase n=1 Tax=Cylas formicarius TaxID=197179 RepID=UPI0029585EC4|nr:probable glutamine--tRNA ligase [Cylas formicarius]